jgi:bifunctional DNA-binding transcriptional regulator/antitoxin component of YhaV-PrlF toxin-antitoxin module
MDAYVKMAENGRIVVPSALRAEVGLPTGGDFLARVENGMIILEPHKRALERVRRLVRQYAPVDQGSSVVDELIAERRAEAARE